MIYLTTHIRQKIVQNNQTVFSITEFIEFMGNTMSEIFYKEFCNDNKHLFSNGVDLENLK